MIHVVGRKHTSMEARSKKAIRAEKGSKRWERTEGKIETDTRLQRQAKQGSEKESADVEVRLPGVGVRGPPSFSFSSLPTEPD